MRTGGGCCTAKGAVAPALAVAGRAGCAFTDALHAGPEAARVLDEEEGDLVALAVDRICIYIYV